MLYWENDFLFYTSGTSIKIFAKNHFYMIRKEKEMINNFIFQIIFNKMIGC